MSDHHRRLQTWAGTRGRLQQSRRKASLERLHLACCRPTFPSAALQLLPRGFLWRTCQNSYPGHSRATEGVYQIKTTLLHINCMVLTTSKTGIAGHAYTPLRLTMRDKKSCSLRRAFRSSSLRRSSASSSALFTKAVWDSLMLFAEISG